MKTDRLLWFCHIERKDENDWVNHVKHFEMESRVSVGRQNKTWGKTGNQRTWETCCTHPCSLVICHQVTKANTCQHGTCISIRWGTVILWLVVKWRNWICEVVKITKSSLNHAEIPKKVQLGVLWHFFMSHLYNSCEKGHLTIDAEKSR